MHPDLSVIIVNWNTKQMLEQCLQSVKASHQNLNIEILVVDNDSMDDSTQMVRNNFPEVFLIENRENKGFAKANNQAIKLSHGRYILLLNSDAFVTPDALQTMVQVMENDLSIGIAGACLQFPDGRAQVSYGPLPSFWSEVYCLLGVDKLHKVKTIEQDYIETGIVNGACMLIRKTLLDQIGLLDESFFMFNEEVDLCNRCHNVPAKVVYIQSAKVIHVQGGSTGQTVQRILRLYSGKLQYFYKHFGPNAEFRLKYVMMATAIMKGVIYRLLRIFSLGRIQKDDFWLAVTKGLIAGSK